MASRARRSPSLAARAPPVAGAVDMSIDRSSSDARSRERPRARRRSRRGRGVAVSRNCPADVVDAHRPQTRVDARDRPSARDTRGTTVIVTSRAFGRARVDASSVGARERANARAGRFVRDAMRATTTTTTTRAVGTDDALDVFLRDARAAFRADASEVSVSVGNEACDLDSVACAVAHAYAESASAGGIWCPSCRARERSCYCVRTSSRRLRTRGCRWRV